ncbi:uncharacterized protein LOC128127104 [Lactuca sativa]|uniref:uncharacterized protein LOC128127104 n=1 Tax=Lactuca sativa TaxID=4236 RepID=UPI0022AE7EEE|nr:uncharacterized protein LOC128127104 [Lactuca sativa]
MAPPKDQTAVVVKESNTVTLQCPSIFNVHRVWEAIDPGVNGDAKKNNIAIALLFKDITEEKTLLIGNLGTAKEMWDVLKTRRLGADRIREARVQTLMGEFENLKMKDQEVIENFANKLSAYASRAASLGSVMEETKLVVDLKTIGYDDVVGRLKAYEERIKVEEIQPEQNQVLLANSDEKTKEKEHRCEHCGCGNSNREDYGRGRGGGRGSEKGRGDGRVQRDKSHVKCYKCNEIGHYISECPMWKKKEELNLNCAEIARMAPPKDQTTVVVKESNTVTLQCPSIFNVHRVWEAIDPGVNGDAKKNNIATALLFKAIMEEKTLLIGNLGTAKEMWDVLKTRRLGVDRIREARVQTLMGEFENLKMKDQEVIENFANKLSAYASRAASLGSVMEETKLVKIFLNGLPKCFIHMVASIEQVVDLKTIGYDDVVGRLKAYEERIKAEEIQPEQNQVLLANFDEKTKEKEHRCEYCGCGNSNREDYGRGRGGRRGVRERSRRWSSTTGQEPHEVLQV